MQTACLPQLTVITHFVPAHLDTRTVDRTVTAQSPHSCTSLEAPHGSDTDSDVAKFGDYLADIAAQRSACDWPVFVAASTTLDLDASSDVGATHAGLDSPGVFGERSARRFADHPCVYTTRAPGAERLSIGRGRRCHYVIAHPSVSGFHAELVVLGRTKFAIVDAESRNGTRVETRKLMPGSEAPVVANALVRFGDAIFYFIESSMVRTLARMANPT